MKHGATNTRFIKQYRKNLYISQIQKEILVGTLLGDGHIESSLSGLLARLKVRHTVLSKEYVDWFFSYWKEWTLKGPTFDHCNNSYILRTIYHPDLAKWRNIFYQKNVKVIPRDIDKILSSPLSLAVWFMDDGNGVKGKRIWLRLSTYAFGLKGNKILQKCLDKNFALKATIYNDGKGNYLWFSKSNAIKLYLLIKPYILPCMKYKIKCILRNC